MATKNKWITWALIVAGVFFTLCVGCCSIASWYGNRPDVAEEGIEGETVFRIQLAPEKLKEGAIEMRGEGEIGFNDIEIPAMEREMPAAVAFERTTLFDDRDISLYLEINGENGWERLRGLEGTYREDEPLWMMNDDLVVEVLDGDSAKMRGGEVNFEADLISDVTTKIEGMIERGAVNAAIGEYRRLKNFVE